MNGERAIRNGTDRIAAIALALMALSAGPGFCAEAAPGEKDETTTIIDQGHERTTAAVQKLGTWLDELFADESYEAEINESWARLRLDSFSELYQGTEIDGTARIHLKIPSLNKRLRFEILSPGESDDLEGADAADTGLEDPSSTGDKTSAALSYVFRALENRSIIFRLGLDFDGYSPDPYVGARYRELVPINDHWSFRFIERVRLYSVDGLESRTTLNLDRALEEKTLFRTTLEGTWLQEQPDYFYSLGFSLFRPIDEKSAVEYQWINSFNTDPHRLQQVTFRLRHRQKVWRDWLIFEVAPQVSLPRERNYAAVPGILFRLEAVFGK